MSLLGVDIGGTKIRSTVFDDQLQPVESVEAPTALLRRGTPAFAHDLVGFLESQRVRDHAMLGLVLNGVLDQGRVPYSSLMGGSVDFPLQEYLADRLGMPVKVDDDIHAMGLAEYHLGLGRGSRSLAMLNIGTGIGVAHVQGGHVLRGSFAAGLISEQLIWVDELAEWRSLDRSVCGRGLTDMYQTLTGEHVQAASVMARSQAGDGDAIRTLRAFTTAFSWVLALVSRFYHPEVISINGSVAKSWKLFGPSALTQYRQELETVFWAHAIKVSTLQYPAEKGILYDLTQSKDERSA